MVSDSVSILVGLLALEQFWSAPGADSGPGLNINRRALLVVVLFSVL